LLMLPEEFISRLEQQKYINGNQLVRALEGPSPVSIRLNSEKWRLPPLNSEQVPWCPDGFYLDERPSFTLDPLFHSGCYYPQEASGMFLEEVFRQTANVQQDIKVLDLCGAPGGKATHLSSLIGQNGVLVTNEVIRTRASVLKENITRWGLSNTIVTQNDPSDLKSLSGFFDFILTDAPCSGEGMFRDIVAVKEWSVENTLHCAERQKRILMDIWPALKENGLLVYSTCTFNPGENEENIRWLTEKHKAESVKLDIVNYTGITEIDYQGICGYGFYPDRIRGEGLFISVLRKKEAESSYQSKYKPGSDLKLSREERNIVSDWTTFPEDYLMKYGDEITASPGTYNDLLPIFKNLRVVKHGTRICTIKNRNYIPSHEMGLSTFFSKNVFPVIKLDYEQALTYLRRGNISAGDSKRGWNMVNYEGVTLGFVNNIGSRLNNYYPVEWRIRMDSAASDKKRIIKWIK
jgi:16S rRNA C967 or C1407 C5-methylase (RsmB/RsmF family)/NOL1/NOP2/fmu family ribosome biogenesis protein